MEIIDNCTVHGTVSAKNIATKGAKIHNLTVSDIAYNISYNDGMKHIINLENAPSNVEVNIIDGDNDYLLGFITILQSTTTVKTVNFNVNNLLNFEDFSGAISTNKTYVFTKYDDKFTNISSSTELINYKHLNFTNTVDIVTYINTNQTIAKSNKDFIYIQYNNTSNNTNNLYILDAPSGIKYGKDDLSGDNRVDISLSHLKLVSVLGGLDGGVLSTRNVGNNQGIRIARDTKTNIDGSMPIVNGGELVAESDSGKIKFNKSLSGGVAYSTLPYINVAYDIINVSKTVSTPTATTTVSYLDCNIIILNITQNTVLTFTDMKVGVRYILHITQSGVNTVTFGNLLTSGGTSLTLSGNYDVLELIKHHSNTNAILIKSNLNLS